MRGAIPFAILGLLLFPSMASSHIGGDPPGSIPDEVLAVFTGAIPTDIDAFVAPFGQVKHRGAHLPWVVVATASEEAAIAALKARMDVLDAYRPGYVYLAAAPDDPLYPQQDWLPAIGAPTAWDTTWGSHAVRVAVLDTGVDGLHPDHGANLCGPHADFKPTRNRPLHDELGHGTPVTGLLAATTQNAVGVAGVAQACVMVGRTDDPGECEFGNCGSLPVLGPSYHTADAVAWAATAGAHVISMSWSTANSTLLDLAIGFAADRGALLVAAAKNSGTAACPASEDTVGYPARDGRVIAVAALDATHAARRSDSACGPTVELAAPGTALLTTKIGGYGGFQQTSGATPVVSGVAALVLSVDPALSAARVRCILQQSATDLGEPGRDRQTGFGRVDASGAVALALAGSCA